MRKIRKLLILLMLVALLACASALAVGCDSDQGDNTQKENTVTALSLEGWTYGEQAKTPTAVCTYGNATFTYSAQESGEYTATVPTDAGVYFVKATVTETAEYKGAEKIVSFTISKADNAVSGFDAIDGIICHGTPTLSATALYGNITYTYATEESGEYGSQPSVFVAGVYFVKATTEGNNNYNSVSVVKSLTVSHNFAETVSPEFLKVEANCSDYAIYYKSCSACGVKSDAETFDYVEGGYGEHKSVSAVAEVPATCHSVGYTAGEYCSDCQEYISGHEVLNMTEHTWVIDTENSKEPTCTEKGVIAYKCSTDGCTETYETDGDEPIGHLVTTWVKDNEIKIPGTNKCEYQITYSGECEHCHEIQYNTDVVEKHNFYYTVTTEPTCQHAGEKTEYCLDADCIYHTQAHGTASYPLPENSDGHDWQVTSTPNVYECSHCHATKTVVSSDDDKLENVSVGALDGVDEIQLSTASVSLDDGVKDQLSGTFTISAAEITDKTAINTDLLSEEEKAQFNNSKAVYDFTLTSNGDNISNFGEDNYITIKIPYVLQAGDNPDKIIVWCVKEDGSAEPFDAAYANGYVTFKTNHFSIYTVVEMTAEEYCAVNNCHSDEYIAANPDKFLVVEPTCTIGGYTVCLNCGEIINHTPATGHNWYSHTVSAVLCAENGHVHNECSVCGMSYETYIPATGHYYVISEQIAATCTERGSVTYECTHCHDSYTVYTAKTDHRYVIETVEATCTANGYTKKTCHLCGSETVTNYVPALGHVYGNEWVKSGEGHYHVCERCGEIDGIRAHIPGAEATETTAQICTDCGYVITAPLGHVCSHHLTEVSAKEADCLNGGNVKYYVCECGKWYLDENAEQLIVDHLTVYTDALGHDAEQRGAVDPTCETVGYTAGIWCNRCNRWVKGHIEIPATGHSYTATVIKATCENGGKTVYTCTACGHTYEGNYTSALGHKYIATVHAPNCSEGGYTEYVCSICGDHYIDNETPALGHKISTVWNRSETEHWHECGRCGEKFDVAEHSPDYSEATDAHGIKCTVCGYEIADRLDHVHSGVKHDRKEPTCTEGGSKEYYVCSCGDWFYDAACENKVENKADLMIQPNGHTAEFHNGVNATCVSEGRTDGYYCTVCEKWISGNKVIPVNPDNHAHVTHHAAIAPDCTKNGAIEYWTCDDCKKAFFDAACTNEITDMTDIVVGSLGHDYDAVVTEPDCTHGGYTTHTCSRCGDSYVGEETDALGHDYDAVVTEPDCTHGGYTTHTCSRCGDSYVGEETDALGHDYDAVVTEPDCIHGGYTTHTCSRCGDSYVGEETDALGHDYNAVVTEPDCIHGGYTTHTCSRCGDEYIEEYGALGHDWQADEVVAPTCTAGGYTHYHCSRCDNECTDDYTDPIPHSYKDQVTEPTCTKGGYTIHTCSVCGTTVKDSVTEPLGHAYKDEVVEPTCELKGYTKHVCERCGEFVIDTYTNPLGHDYSEPTYVWSDDMTTVRATRWCLREQKIIDDTTARVIQRVIQKRSCTDDEITEYVAQFDLAVFETQTQRVVTAEAYGHTSSMWSSDENRHYHICSRCGIIYDQGAHVPDYEEATEEHGITCMVCGYEIAPKKEQPQEKEEQYRYVSSYAGPEGDTEVTYIFYNNSDYEATTVSGGEQVYYEEGNWQAIDGKITLYAKTEGIYYSFAIVSENAITPYFKDGEVKYTALVFNYLDCAFYADGIWTFNMGGVQFFNNYTEKDGKVIIAFANQTLTFVVDKDGTTLIPDGEQQEKVVLYSFSDRIEMNGYIITYDYTFYTDNTYYFVSVYGGEDTDEISGKWKDVDNKITINTEGMYISFAIENGKISPYIKDDSSVKYTGDIFAGTYQCNFYEDGVYTFMIGKTQFFNNWYEQGDKIMVVLPQGTQTYVVNADGTTLIPDGEPQVEKVLLYTYFIEIPNVGEFTFNFYDDGLYLFAGEDDGEYFEDGGEWQEVDGTITVGLDGFYLTFVINGDELALFTDESEVVYTANRFDQDYYFLENGKFVYYLGDLQVFNNWNEQDGKVYATVGYGYRWVFTINEDGKTLTPDEGAHAEKTLVYQYEDIIKGNDVIVGEAEYLLYSDNSVVLTIRGKNDNAQLDGYWMEDTDEESDVPFIRCEFGHLKVIFDIDDKALIPFVYDDIDIAYQGKYNGTAIRFGTGDYDFMFGTCQFYGDYTIEKGKYITVEIIGDSVTFEIGKDGTLTPYEEEPQEEKQLLYTYAYSMSQGDETANFNLAFYNNFSLNITITADGYSMSRETGWSYTENGMVYYKYDDFYMEGTLVIGADGKTLTPYEKPVEGELVYTSNYQGMPMEFYDNGKFTITFGGNSMEGTWSVIVNNVVGADIGGEVLYLTINEDGRTLDAVTDETTIFTFRVAVVSDDGRYLATENIEFTYYDPKEYPKMDYPYQSSTSVTFRESGFIRIEKTLDGENYLIESRDDQFRSAGSYEINYKKNTNGGSSYSCWDLSEYQMPTIGTAKYEDGKYYYKDKNGNNIELAYTEEDGVYRFDLAEASKITGYGFDFLYFTLDGRKFQMFVPETEVLYTIDGTWFTVKLYDGYLLFIDDNTKYCTDYDLMQDDNGDIYIVTYGERLHNVIGERAYITMEGELIDGWQEGDVQAEVRIKGIRYDGDNNFIVGQGSYDDLKFTLEYSDGSSVNLKASDLKIEGNLDFNVAGRYTINATYYANETNSYGTGVTIRVGNPNDVLGRYIQNSTVTWIIDERGNVQPDLSSVYLAESTFAGTSSRRQLTVRDLNTEDYKKAINGKSKDYFTVRTVYNETYDPSRYLQLTVVTITKADIAACYENTMMNGQLFYYIDGAQFVNVSNYSQATLTVNYKIVTEDETNEGEIHHYEFTVPYIVPIALDLFDLEGNDFTATSGTYNVPISNGINDIILNVPVVSFKTADVQVVFFIGDMKTQDYVTLPDAYVGERIEEYENRVYDFINSDNIVIMYMHMANNVGLDSEMLYTVERGALDVSRVNTASEGVQSVIMRKVNFLGFTDEILLTVNVVSAD